jgi:hypothetical protein
MVSLGMFRAFVRDAYTVLEIAGVEAGPVLSAASVAASRQAMASIS